MTTPDRDATIFEESDAFCGETQTSFTLAELQLRVTINWVAGIRNVFLVVLIALKRELANSRHIYLRLAAGMSRNGVHL